MSWVCDGTAQCQDGLDEAHCCQPGQFRCTGTPVCISGTALCDGWDNCADGSDEKAPVCAAANNRRQDIGLSTETGKSNYVIAIIVVVIAVTLVAIPGFFYCRRKLASNEELPDILHDSAGDPLSPKPGRSGKPILTQKNGAKDLKASLKTVRMSNLTGSSIGSSYDRSHITGESPTLFSICSWWIIFGSLKNIYVEKPMENESCAKNIRQTFF